MNHNPESPLSKTRKFVCTAFALTFTIFTSPAAWSHAEVFSDYSYEQAKDQAQKDNKFLLIDFTASWCPPCRQMEKTTWTDSSIQSWVKENAVAIQIDVDRDEKTSEALHVNAMPTLVLFKPQNTATECGRQVGYMDSAELLRWLQGLKSGKSAQEVEKDQEAANNLNNSVFEHIGKARAFESAGKNDEAMAEYIWLWNNAATDDANVGPIRTHVLPIEMKKLVSLSPSARNKCVELRDAADKSNNRSDWLAMNSILDENDRTLTWFDKAKVDPHQQADIQKLHAQLEPVLASKARWNDITTYCFPNPIATVNEYFKLAQDMKKPSPHTEVSQTFDPFPPMVMTMYAAFLGAGKDVEAHKIADECLRLDNSADMKDSLNRIDSVMQKIKPVQAKTTK